MRVTIDYTPAIAQGAGIGRYTRSLVSALARVDLTTRYTLFSVERPSQERGFPSAADMPTMRPRLWPVGVRYATAIWQRARLPLPIEFVSGRASVFHGTDFTLPPALLARRVVTIHDLAFLTQPQYAFPKLVTYLSRVVPRSVREADHIIAVSQSTAADLVTHLGVVREKISVIHIGVDPSVRRIEDPARIAALEARYGLRHPFILAVGTIEPRKNYEELIAAFAHARQTADGPRQLVIAGRKGWLYDGVFAAVQRHGLQEAVRFLDYVPDDDLPTLYTAADALAMPSYYEGFGIPVIEAMACGTPVVCSTGGALPEVAGDAALIVAPDDVDGLADALVRLVSYPTLREELRHRGLARAQRFTWDDAGRAHANVYRRLAGVER
ncbi:MAG TPA: glycosyltransferase family 1 protein [Ktedonobacterales bacterium]|nr:glycosyltransferase family 1 protein [Ktedonobacterales bacterium]